MESKQFSKERGLLGRLSSGEKKLKGKTFYLDNVGKRSTALLLEAISFLGGRVESFLHKDVSFVLTGNHEGQTDEKCVVTKGGAKGKGTQHPVTLQERGFTNPEQQPGTPRLTACGSRGKAMLEKAIRNNERLQKSCVLSNAKSWGVKILLADDVLSYVKQLTRDSFSAKNKRTEKASINQSFPSVKAVALRSPYLKIEDISRKYKPLHMQSMTFPALYYSGRFSPFEPPPPPRFEKQSEQRNDKTREKKDEIQEKSQSLPSFIPSAWRPRKKDVSYCECCRQSFSNLEEHLQTDQHRSFVLDHSNYTSVDQLVAEMLPGFDPTPSQKSKEKLNRPPTPLPIHDTCELEPLTDSEMKHTVKDLQRQGSSCDTHISSPTSTPLSSDPVSPLAGVNVTTPNPDAFPADSPPLSLKTDCYFSCIQSHASISAVPVLTVEPQAQDQLDQKPKVISCPIDSCLFLDPYALPPVLSPQVPYFPHIIEQQCHYSDPPILSPQKSTRDETLGGYTPAEMDIAECVSTVPLSVPLLLSVTPNAEKEGESNPEELAGFSGLVCSSRHLICAAVSSHGPHSLPHPSAVAPNPKKRCRSASPEQSQSKRRTASFRHSGSWSEPRLKAAKLQRDKITDSGCLFEKDSSHLKQPCPDPDISMSFTYSSVDMIGLQQTSTSFSFPAVEYVTQVHNQADSADDQPSCLLPPKAKNFDPPDATDKPPIAISSQDSQFSLSHATSICIEPALIPDQAMVSSSSSESDWDCNLLSNLDATSAAPLTPMEQNCELDKELLHRPCPWMHNTSYESHLHAVLQSPAAATSLCGEDPDASAFSRTVVQIVEVQH